MKKINKKSQPPTHMVKKPDYLSFVYLLTILLYFMKILSGFMEKKN